MTVIYAGHVAASGYSLTQLNDAGSLQWRAAVSSATIYACCVDSDAHVIFAGSIGGGSANLWKYQSDGTAITEGWPIQHNSSTSDRNYGLATDDDDAVYLAGERTSTNSRPIAKYAASGGSPVWTQTSASTIDFRAVAVDAEGYSVFVGNGGQIRKYSSAGSLGNAFAPGGTAFAVATSGTDAIVAGTIVSGNNIRRYQKDGGGLNTTPVFARNYLNATLRAVAVDSSDNIYVGAEKVTDQDTLAKFSSDGTLIWSVDTEYSVFAIALDEINGFVYVERLGRVRKYNSSTGDHITAGGWPYLIGTSIYALALHVTPPPEVHGLPMPLGVGLPLGTFGHTAGGLLVPMAVALPTASVPPLPPIAPARTVYHAIVGTGEEVVRLPVLEFQCRRRRNDSTWLGIRLPGIDRAAWLRSLGAVTVRLYAGDGVTMGEFLRATLTDVAEEQSVWSATTTLTCRAAGPADAFQTRELAGVEKIVIDNGRRFVRCNQVDFRLRPGDFAVAAGETFLVYGVSYRVGATLAIMDVREAP